MVIKCKTQDMLPISALTEFQGGLKARTNEDYEKINRSIEKHGFSFPFFVWKTESINYVLDGHGRLGALQRLVAKGEQLPELPVVYVDCKDEAEAKEILLKLNSQYGTMTTESVLEFLDGLQVNIEDFALPSGTLDLALETKNESSAEEKKELGSILKKEFMFSPFSILDSRKGEWQQRKKMWISLGIKSDSGRDVKLLSHLSSWGRQKTNQKITIEESIFDPVLCELIYTWFGRKDCQVLDPFAGGSVRGLIAGVKGMNYTGFDIRQEQIDANEKQRNVVDEQAGIQPQWFCHDSAKMDDVLPAEYKCDLMMSCPPYADLEVYSDKEGDISNMKYPEFLKAYREIINKACSRLNDNRFAVFVVGECRNKKTGNYHNFIGDTITAFLDAGMHYYNEIILINPIGSKSWSSADGMRKSRKVGKVHQNILVFVKGDAKKATEYLGDIEVADSNDFVIEEIENAGN